MKKYILKAFFSPRVFLGTSILFLLFLLVGEAFAAAPELSIGNPLCDTNPPAGPAIRLNWTASTGAASYIVYRNGSIYVNVLATDLTFYNSTNVIAGQSYSYFVRAKNAAGNVISDSNTVNVSIPINICSASAPPSAQIRDYSVSPRNVKRGESATLLLTVTNTGSSISTFYAAATLRKPDNSMVDLQVVPLSLSAGQYGNASWIYSFDTEGSWDVVFGIWQESGKVKSLGHTGWLNDYVLVSATCTPNWQIGSWGDCANGQQTKTVTDSNNCGTTTNKPVVTQSCVTQPQRPTAPSNISATALSSISISLVWQDNASNETGFKIEGRSSGGTYAQINMSYALSGTGSEGYYLDGTLLAGTNYCYRVRAYNSAGDSDYSNEICATTKAAPVVHPTATTDSATAVMSNSATLNATVNPNGVLTEAFFGWGTSIPSFPFDNTTNSFIIGSGNVNVNVSANLTGLTPNTTYYFKAIANSSKTVYGTTQTFTTSQVSQAPTPKPTAKISANPSNVTSGSSVTISWKSTNATSCTVSPTNWTGASGSQIETLTASKTYTLNCSGAGGSADTVTVTVTVDTDQTPLPANLAIENFTIDKQSVNAGDTVKMQFIVRNRGGIPSQPFSGRILLSSDSNLTNGKELFSNAISFPSINPNYYNGYFGDSYSTPSIPANTQTGTYYIGILADNGLQKSLPIAVTGNFIPLPTPVYKPTAKITANPLTVLSGSQVTITWSSTNATSCAVSPDGWTGTSDNKTETLTASKTYTLNCSGQGGSADTVSVTVTSVALSKFFENFCLTLAYQNLFLD